MYTKNKQIHVGILYSILCLYWVEVFILSFHSNSFIFLIHWFMLYTQIVKPSVRIAKMRIAKCYEIHCLKLRMLYQNLNFSELLNYSVKNNFEA